MTSWNTLHPQVNGYVNPLGHLTATTERIWTPSKFDPAGTYREAKPTGQGTWILVEFRSGQEKPLIVEVNGYYVTFKEKHDRLAYSEESAREWCASLED